jgi:hypothetical protein
MTPEQRAQYESDRAQAEAVYLRSMMETNAIVTRARMPAKPKPARQSWWSRLLRRMTDKTTDGVDGGHGNTFCEQTPPPSREKGEGEK